MKTAWIALIIVVPFLAGCASEKAEPFRESDSDTLEEGQFITYSLETVVDATLAYKLDMTGESGLMSVSVMDADEVPNFKAGAEYKVYENSDRDGVRSASEQVNLSPGKYAVGLTCTSGPCSYTITINVNPL